jgi:hypothetical protein
MLNMCQRLLRPQNIAPDNPEHSQQKLIPIVGPCSGAKKIPRVRRYVGVKVVAQCPHTPALPCAPDDAGHSWSGPGFSHDPLWLTDVQPGRTTNSSATELSTVTSPSPRGKAGAWRTAPSSTHLHAVPLGDACRPWTPLKKGCPGGTAVL